MVRLLTCALDFLVVVPNSWIVGFTWDNFVFVGKKSVLISTKYFVVSTSKPFSLVLCAGIRYSVYVEGGIFLCSVFVCILW